MLALIRTRGSLDIPMAMLMVNLDCSDSQAASTSWRQQFFVRGINAAEKFPVVGCASHQWLVVYNSWLVVHNSWLVVQHNSD